MVHYQPEHYQSVVPYLVVPDARRELQFLKEAFGATAQGDPMEGPDGTIAHAEVRIGDCVIMLGQSSELHRQRATMLYLYLPDCDTVYQHALSVGGTSVREPADQFYGDRNGAVTSPGGNEYWISTHIEDPTPEQMQERMQAAMAAMKG